MSLELESKVNPLFSWNKDDLKQIFGSLKNITDESVKITLESEGILIRTMDRSHVALLDIRIKNSDLSEFELMGDIVEFNINPTDVYNIIKELDKKGDIIFEIKRDFIEISQNGFKTQVKKLEKNDQDVPLPKIPYNSKFITKDTKHFIDLVKKFESVSDYIKFNQSENKLIFSGSGDQGNTEFNYSEFADLESKSDIDSITNYSIEYIQVFLKSMVNKKALLIFEYSNEKPLRISLGDNIQYYLAPRIES